MKINRNPNEKDYLRDRGNRQFVGFEDMKMRFVYGRVRGKGTVMRGWGGEQQCLFPVPVTQSASYLYVLNKSH